MAEEQHWEANRSAYGKVKISFLLQKWHLAYDTDDNITKNLLHDIYKVCVCMSIKDRKAMYLFGLSLGTTLAVQEPSRKCLKPCSNQYFH